MTSIGFYEARAPPSELLDQVARGKKILITRRGKPAAILQPPPEEASRDVKKVVKGMLEYRDRQKRTLGGIKVRELIDEGRHSKSSVTAGEGNRDGQEEEQGNSGGICIGLLRGGGVVR